MNRRMNRYAITRHITGSPVKNAVIAALIAAIAIGGALGAFAATRTVETTANVEVAVWRRISDGGLFLSTRPEGGNWSTSSALQMTTEGNTGRYERSSLVAVVVPVEVQVEVSDPPTTSPTVTPQPNPTPTPKPPTNPMKIAWLKFALGQGPKQVYARLAKRWTSD